MAKYQKYAEYKDSGIEWADKLPAHWNSVHLKWISTIYAGGTPSKTIESYWENGTVPWINSGAVNQTYILEPSTYITKTAYENSSAKWIPKKALVMALAGQGKTKGMVAQLGIDTTCNQSMGAIIPNDLSYARYLFWWITSNYQNIRNMAGGDLRDGLNLEHLGNMNCPLPTYEETQKIANFLDHETAKIDTLIAKQEKLIELLKEKRQAVISHAVTKGLNTDVAMKDSGVEWLGQVPEHWSVAKIKHLSKIISKGTTPTTMGGDFVFEGIRFLKAENIGKKPIVNSSPEFFITENVDAQLARSRLQEHDVLVIIAGATTGLSSVLQKELLPANTNQAVSFIRPKETEYAKWISYWLSTHFAQSLIWMGAVQAAQPNLSMENLGNIDITLPSVEEIKTTLDFIDTVLLKIDDLIEKNIKAIDFMQERRTALISSAVTGKIDVRNWQHPNEAKKGLSS
ncbi:restriction endonuclease subunit S [Acinetobacter indicus]|uniref:restriction endonuclease subunit S n=1 Tax=Acinetobacter indicus TaxID=756892 RepID=UPI002575A45D|nr:restriction endonuclease subunit S [Acinetobacter indicus]MDM1262540.1 restriction endonuclease subunit S [Acinetobacter indicus]